MQIGNDSSDSSGNIGKVTKMDNILSDGEKGNGRTET